MKLLAGLLIMFFVSTSSGLCATILSDANFDSGSITQTDFYNGSVNQWLTDGTWHTSETDPYNGKYAETGTDESNLYQVVNYAGDSGYISRDYYEQINPSGLHFYIYGSNTKPEAGYSWDDPHNFGTLLWSTVISGYAGDDWTNVNNNHPVNQAYSWYTIRFKGQTGSYTDSVKLDDVSIEIPSATVPIPSSLILFLSGSGILLRRKLYNVVNSLFLTH